MNTEQHYPIICNQENFLLRGNGYKIKQCLPNARIIFKKAMKDNMDCGRPKNGMFIAVPEEIKELVTDISPNHWRIQAVILQTVNNRILIINSYFPTDPKIADFDESELLTTLSTIESVLDENEYDDVVWAGDINAEFSRNTHYTNVIQSFVRKNRCSNVGISGQLTSRIMVS